MDNSRLSISQGDREILRGLAARVAELAARPLEEQKRTLWYRHNALEPTRPLIVCDPEHGWGEIITKDRLQCRGEMARLWEERLRKDIFRGEKMGDDSVIERIFEVWHVYTESDWGMSEKKIGVVDGQAYRWESPLKSYADLGKLKYPEITVNAADTEAELALADDTLGDILEVKLTTQWWWSLGLAQVLAKLRGLEQMMVDMYDEADGLHRLMTFLRDGYLRKLDFLESNNLLRLNTRETYVGSGGFGYTRELPRKDYDGVHVRTLDMWGFGESQELSSVSPEMYEEFVFPYELPILERFGLNCYGCCEPLDKRWHVVKRFPRLRRVSVSPWASLEAMAENLGERYIFSMKPNPSYLALPKMDCARVRKDLRKAIRITRGCRVEIIMKDTHTVGNNPENVINWCRIAREEAE